MRVTSQHWEVFLEICEKHPNIITGKFNGAQGKAEGHTLWQNITITLNALGLGEKTESEWRRAVTDWKSKVKVKAAKVREEASQTGGGPSTCTPLTPLEERLIMIMGKKGFAGDEGITELGLPSVPICQANQTIQKQIYQSECEHDEENQDPTIHQEHNYCEGKNANKKGKRIQKKTIKRISDNLEEMTSESLKILKSDQNTNRIANAFERVADVLVKKFTE